MMANPSEYNRFIDASADYTAEHPYAPTVSSRPAPACPSTVPYTEPSLRTSQWTRFDREINIIRLTKAGGPPASSVIRREVTDARTGEIILDESAYFIPQRIIRRTTARHSYHTYIYGSYPRRRR